MSTGCQLASQSLYQFVAGKACYGQNSHVRQFDAAAIIHCEGIVHIQAAAPEPQDQAVAGRDNRTFSAFGEISLKKIGPIWLGRICCMRCSAEQKAGQDKRKVK